MVESSKREGKESKLIDFDPNLDLLHPNNRRAAEQRGLVYDPVREKYVRPKEIKIKENYDKDKKQ